ncbi:Leucine-rich repeat transmembrane protein FLRT3 [Nymphon striatum]|nr:Leucine-rich repeat transmembrane protein FLRT3 [Nymphon striatum]
MVSERCALILLCLIVKTYGLYSLDSACPPPESITPCVCKNELYTYHGFYEIDCKDKKDLITYKFSDIRENIATAMKGQNPMIFTFENLKEPKLYDNFFKDIFMLYLIITDSNIEDISDNAFNGNEESLRVLNIGKSNLKKIPVGALKNLKLLTTLIMSNSNITTISKLEMEELPSTIEYLNFDGNQINSIGKNAFAKSFPRLRYLGLSKNILSSFLETTPKSLRKLFLDGNNLKYFPPNAWKTMSEGSQIHLVGNEITSLPSETSMKIILQKNITVFLGGNDINCDCNTKWVLGSQIDLNKFIPIINCGQNSGKRSSKNVSQLTQEDYSDC